jgi:hypothetical protein
MFGIYLGILFILILTIAGLIVWVHKSQGSRPYFLYTNSAGEWVVYSESEKKADLKIPWDKVMTESLITHFAQNYFMISKDNDTNNNSLWCETKKCDTDIDACKVYCNSTPAIYGAFANDIIPLWKDKAANGEIQQLDPDTIKVEEIREISDENIGKFWKLTGTLKSNKNKDRNIICFVTVSSNRSLTPQTFGLYVSEFVFYEDLPNPGNNKI